MRVLITGGAGSIGSETAKWLVREGHSVRVLDINEEGLWNIKAELPQVETYLGDVQFKDEIDLAAIGCDAIIHCAALKHVHLCEQNKGACYRVNVQGSRNAYQVAAGRRFVFLSSDKAIDPCCAMGKSKATTERDLKHWTNANIVRFGNVLGSRGSILPAVLRYRDLGQPIPMTDPEMTRFFMPITEAVWIIGEALHARDWGRVFTTAKPRSAKIGKFIAVCRALLAPSHPIATVGKRTGERMHEKLILEDGREIMSNDPKYGVERAAQVTNIEVAGVFADRADHGGHPDPVEDLGGHLSQPLRQTFEVRQVGVIQN
jgi:UDP-glucose 4-epimerase